MTTSSTRTRDAPPPPGDDVRSFGATSPRPSGEDPPGGGVTRSPDAALPDAALLDALHRVWGFSGFRPLQREAMHAVLGGRDSVVVLPTGEIGRASCRE